MIDNIIKELQHYKDSTSGLWCIDKNPNEVSLEWIRENAFQLESFNTNEEIEKCKNSIVYFANNYCNIQHPQKGKILCELYRYQENILKLFFQRKKIILNKSRQIGVSTMESIYATWLLLFKKDVNIGFISTKRDTSLEYISHIKTILNNLPIFLKPNILENKDIYSIFFKNGNYVKVNSEGINDTCRYSHIFFNEFAFFKNPENTFLNYLPLTFDNTQFIISSTPNGKNYFYHLWENAEIGENDFLSIKLKWDVHPKRNSSWRETQSKEFGIKRATQEFDCEFI